MAVAPVPYSQLKPYTGYIAPAPSDEARFLTGAFARNEYMKKERRLLLDHVGKKMLVLGQEARNEEGDLVPLGQGASLSWNAQLQRDNRKSKSINFDETSFPPGQLFQEVGWDWKPPIVPVSYRELKKGDSSLEDPAFVDSITLIMRNDLCSVKTSDGTVTGIGERYVNQQMDVSKWDEHRRLGLLYEPDTQKIVGVILYDYMKNQIDDSRDGLKKTVVYRKFICGKGFGDLINTNFEASVIKQTQDARLAGVNHILIMLAAIPSAVPLHENAGYTLNSSEPDDSLHYMSKTIRVPPVAGVRRRTARVSSRHKRKSRLTRKKRLHPPGIGPG